MEAEQSAPTEHHREYVKNTKTNWSETRKCSFNVKGIMAVCELWRAARFVSATMPLMGSLYPHGTG